MIRRRSVNRQASTKHPGLECVLLTGLRPQPGLETQVYPHESGKAERSSNFRCVFAFTTLLLRMEEKRAMHNRHRVPTGMAWADTSSGAISPPASWCRSRAGIRAETLCSRCRMMLSQPVLGRLPANGAAAGTWSTRGSARHRANRPLQRVSGGDAQPLSRGFCAGCVRVVSGCKNRTRSCRSARRRKRVGCSVVSIETDAVI